MLIASISTGMLNFQRQNDTAAFVTATIFTMVALFAVAYSGTLFMWRALKIRERNSSNVYSDSIGPTFLCFSILAATVVNFIMRYIETSEERLLRGVAN